MSVAFYNQEWLGGNSQRSYPLSELATKADVSGDFVLPDDIVLSLYLNLHYGLNVDAEGFFLRTVGKFPGGLLIEVGYDDGTASGVAVASTVVSTTTHGEYDSYRLTGIGDFDDVVGQVSLGSPDAIRKLPPGVYTFSRAGGQLEPDAIRPGLRSVQAMIFTNGSESSGELTGIVEIVSGRNTRFAVSRSGDVNRVTVDAISGEGLNEACDCEEEAPCIKTINGVGPDDNQNFDLIGDACFGVETTTGLIRVSDNCSAPCCGCVELEQVTRDLDTFRTEAATLRSVVGRLDAETSRTQISILGLKTRDRGCVELYE